MALALEVATAELVVRTTEEEGAGVVVGGAVEAGTETVEVVFFTWQVARLPLPARFLRLARFDWIFPTLL